MRLILLPGLAADERMYAGLGAVGVSLETPRLPAPDCTESMSAYARRIADDLGIGADDLIGGCSFGSLLAAEIARHRAVRALFLIAGALSSATIRWPARLLGGLPKAVPLPLLRRLFASEPNLRFFFGGAQKAYFPLARRMLDETPDALLHYGAALAVGYFPSEPVPCPVLAIHGGRDRIMAPPPVAHCRIIAGAGHGLAMSHADEVTQALRREVQRLTWDAASDESRP